MKKYLIILWALLFVSCGKNTHIHIQGKVENGPEGEKIFLQIMNVNTLKTTDSCKISRSGRYTFSLAPRNKDPQFYQLLFPNGKVITLLAAPGEKIHLQCEYDNFGYRVTGSKGSQLTRDLVITMNNTKKKLDSLVTVYKKLPLGKEQDEERLKLQNEYAALINAQHKYNIGFILAHYKSMASIMALYQKYDDSTWVFNSAKDLQFFKIVSDTLFSLYPSSMQVKALRADLARQLNIRQSMYLQALAARSTVKFPDLTLPDIKMDSVRLSSLQGKVILLSFSLSSLVPCKVENREYTELYKRFGNKKFEIYQIFLDDSFKSWRNAMIEEGYPWISVWDGPYQNSKSARIYNIQELPANYLISKQGDIVGSNISSNELPEKIAGLLR